MSNKILVMVHQVAFFVAQLVILTICGIAYSGSLAYIGSISSILAILISLRWDIQIMVSKTQGSFDKLLDASISICIMSIILILTIVVFNVPLPLHIIISAISIAIHEVFISIIFVQGSLILYAFFRSLPAIFLIALALLDYKPEVIWPTSFLISASCLLIYFSRPLNKSIYDLNMQRVKRISIIPKLYSTITATLLTLISSSFVIIISLNFGDEYTGIWSNTIRIFNSILSFILATFLPFTLTNLRKSDLKSEKVSVFIKLWMWLSPIIIITYFIVLNYGSFVFSLFTPISSEVDNTQLSYIFLTGTFISFISSAQGLYQAVNKSFVLLRIIVVTISLAGILFYNLSFDFNQLLELFLLVSSVLFWMSFVYIKYFLKS